MNTPVLYTPHLCLRPFHAGEAQLAYDIWFSQPDVAKYMFWGIHSNVQETQAWLDFELSQIGQPNWYRFAIEERHSRTLIGSILLYYEEEIQDWEVAYHFSRNWWGQGYATESLLRIVIFSRQTLYLHNIAARYARENYASGRVLQKAGFQMVGTVPYYCNNGSVFYEGVLCRLSL